MKVSWRWKLLVLLIIAVIALAISAIIWGIIIWRLGVPFDMPFTLSVKTAIAAKVFTGRYLLTAVLIFVVLGLPTYYFLAKRRLRIAAE
ncbi:MAG: hypothetical protein M1371_03395 [Actinobacteria bacterium]|nr:hypothetical protein [Actinomycetota bacterium]